MVKFSHNYEKLPPRIKGAVLYAVIPIAIEYQTMQFIGYDTKYVVGGVPNFYPLPTKGKYMVLCYLSESGAFFTTIRRYTPNKFGYYHSMIGKFDKVKVE